MAEPTAVGWQNILDLVEQQARDDGLWFEAVTAPEAYLQQELRKLHMLIEKPYDYAKYSWSATRAHAERKSDAA
jgi:hypothetical protein